VLFPRTHAAESFAYQARATLEKQIAVKTDKTYPVTEHPEFNGRYRISEPAVYAGQVITISQGDGCLNLQLNDGGPYRVFPDSTGNFLLLGFSGLEIACIFRRDPEGMINELRMDGSGVSMVARREE